MPSIFAMRSCNVFPTAISFARWLRRAGPLSPYLDFSEIAALSAGRNVSVIVLRLHNTRFGRLIERLSAVLAESISALERGAILIIEESRHRIRFFSRSGLRS